MKLIGDIKNNQGELEICNKTTMCKKNLVCCKPNGSDITNDKDGNLAGLCIKPPHGQKKCKFKTGVYVDHKINESEARYEKEWNLEKFYPKKK